MSDKIKKKFPEKIEEKFTNQKMANINKIK